MPELRGQSTPITLQAGFSVEAPDLVGTAEVVDARAHVRSSASGTQEQSLLDALDAEGMQTELMVEVTVREDRAPTGPGGRRRDGLRAVTRGGEAAIVLRAEQTRPNRDYAVLYTDEQGVSRWIFPEPDSGAGQRRGRELVFHLPRESAPPPNAAADREQRGPISKLGRRVVRMLMWATDEIAGQGVNAFIRNWEERKRPYGFHAVRAGHLGGAPDWDTLQQGRALLLLHGTFSMGQTAFDGLVNSPRFAQIAAAYEGRIFAFNHPSLHHSPRDNVQTLLEMLPPTANLDLDIVTHSRGGLVGRVLTEQLPTLNQGNRTLRIKRAIFVAAPLRGTILADGDHWIDFVDRYTNLLTHLPDNVYTLTLEALLALVKIIGHGATVKLAGLNSMWPNGEFLHRLNTGVPHECTYYALSADFRPPKGELLTQLRAQALDALVDKLFGEENDGVVPTNGCYATDTAAPGFPIPPERRRVWTAQAELHHTNFFYQDRVNAQIAEWLAA